ncbi:response regulator transcription factor [Neolewinella lacunae]|uniref:Response regulator transcription factor n=1 Tax=Neolewinella lacunae TaxID=1517758 RepID=A0A923PJZ5_9BACT|nr:response regulator transcription factor [Neolewinella lacunae]MBC6992704.1 response regulator transcription factor [Neolewinella lacunae]MDN3633584.1 response regulator transcription factor [Neolewinella lacunae]
MLSQRNTTERPLELVIVEDDRRQRELLELLLNGTPGFYCRAAFPDAEALLAELPGLHPGLVLMDIDLGSGRNGVAAVAEIRARRPELPVVMLTVHEDSDYVFAALCAGAVGYLVKGIAPAELLAAVQDAASGGSPMSPQIARRVVQTFHVGPANPLTEREKEVLAQLCAGESYRSIAEALFISGHTVRSHIKNIYEKLHVHTRAEAVVKALKDRLIQ